MISLYSELTFLIVGLMGVMFVVALFTRQIDRRLLIALAALALSPLVFNPIYTTRYFGKVLFRSGGPGPGELFPWAFEVYGWTRVWFGDFFTNGPNTVQTIFRVATIGAYAVGFYGLWQLWRDAANPAERALASMALAVSLLPILILCKDSQHPYQLYKLLQTVAPLYVLGFALCRVGWGRWGMGAKELAFVAILVVAVYSTARITAKADRDLARGHAHYLHTAQFERFKTVLESTPPTNVIVAEHSEFLRSWLAYHGRKHHVQLPWPTLIYTDLRHHLHQLAPFHLDAIPERTLVVVNHSNGLALEPGDIALVEKGETGEIWQSGKGAWALPIAFSTEFGVEQVAGKPYFWFGSGKVWLEVLASSAGVIAFDAEWHPGPALPSTRERVIVARTSQGESRTFRTKGGRLALEMPVRAGQVSIWLECVDTPAPALKNAADARTLLVGARDFAARFTPGPDQTGFSRKGDHEGDQVAEDVSPVDRRAAADQR
jgi:hypothetical protein